MTSYYKLVVGTLVGTCLFCAESLPVTGHPCLSHGAVLVQLRDLDQVGEHIEQEWFATLQVSSEVVAVSGTTRASALVQD